MAQLFTNNASTTLASAITNVATSITVATGKGALFPTPTGGDYFLATLVGYTGSVETSWEIVKCTARAGDVLTVTRAQEGTTAVAWGAGTTVELRITAGSVFPSATTSTNLAGGGAGRIPYQSAVGTTAMLAAGTSGQILQSNGTAAPSWVAAPSFSPATPMTPPFFDLGSVPFPGAMIGISQSGSVFRITVTNSCTIDLAPGNLNVTRAFILELINGGSSTITWSSSSAVVKWAGGVAPTLTTTGKDILGFYNVNNETSGAATIYNGFVIAKDVK